MTRSINDPQLQENKTVAHNTFKWQSHTF